MIDLPTLPCGRISWRAISAGKNPGDIVEVPLAYRHAAPAQLARLGYRVKSHATPTSVRITFVGLRSDPQPEVPTPQPSAHVRHPIYQMGILLNKIEHTKTRIANFRIEANECSLHSARIEAGARVLLYESQLRVLRNQLAILQNANA